MPKKAVVKLTPQRTNLVRLPPSAYASLVQQGARPQSLILHFTPIISGSASSSRPAKSAYLGWSGLNAQHSLSSVNGEMLETVEVDPEVALGLGWSAGTIVEIAIIRNPIRAKSISVTPLTSDDWEILEQNARFLEDNLLFQLRAAQKGQVIDAWVAGKSKIQVRVDDTFPATSHTSAVLVHPDTEIYVAPKPRSKPKSTTTSPPSEVIGADSQGTAKEKAVKLRIIPQRVAAAWGRPETGHELASGEVAVWANPDTIARIRKKLSLEKQEEASIRLRKRRSAAKADAEQLEPQTGPSSAAEPNDVAGSLSLDPAVSAWLFPWDTIPDGSIVVQGKDVGMDWARVDVLAGTQKRRAKGSKGSPANGSEWARPSSRPRLPGAESLLEESLIYFRLQDAQSRCHPLLLTGGKGSGKTSLAKVIAAELEEDPGIVTEPIYIDVGRVDAEGRVEKIKEEVSGWFDNASEKTPCSLILDGLDMLIAPESELSSSLNPSILAEHFCRAISELRPGVMLLATATSSASLHPLLNIKHVFGSSLKIPAATKGVRQEILRLAVGDDLDLRTNTTAAGPSAPTQQTSLDYVTLASMTEGYSAADLYDLVASARQRAIVRQVRSGENSILSIQDFTDAQAAFTPLSLRGVSLQKSDVKWSDIGGLTETRRVLRETLEWPTKYAQIFANCPLRLRSGLLLFGYPGCGKTLLASAVAKECGLNFISVKGPEILNKYIGASEKSVRDLFERATAAKPCVLFFDEFDSIAPRRGHDSTGVTDRVVNQMLTEMDGAQGLEGVYVLAATSRPDLIDPALLRPGRLDKSLLCGMPDQAERLDILKALAQKLELAQSVDLEGISFETDGFTGADLQAVMYNAHLEVIHTQIDSAALAPNGRTVNEASSAKGKGKGKANGDTPQVAGQTKVGYTAYPEEGGSRAERSAFEARASSGFSWFDGRLTLKIATIVKNSSERSERVMQRTQASALPQPIIEQYHLQRSLSNTRPSVPLKERIKLENIYREFMSDRDGTMSSAEAAGRDIGSRASLM